MKEGSARVTTADGFWVGKTVFVTGGVSFIGSTLTDQLLARGAKKVRIVDDLSSGHLDNIRQHLGTGKVDFLQADLREPGVARTAMQGVDTVFHLAADHGGRGYVDLHQAGPASNFFLDGLVFAEALKAKAKKVVFASSGCVYPNFLQSDTKKELYLTEDLTKGPNDADNTYGWAKVMGDGTQIRNWTYIDDIVEGTILMGEKINDGTAINLGTMERIRVIDCAKMVCEFTGHQAEIKLRRDMPTGPLNRVADNSLAKKLLGWEPKVLFREGLKRTIDWYYATRDKEEVKRIFTRMLTER